jgi:signal transduction histidine kinase/ActR/RegA family two-component response regulator
VRVVVVASGADVRGDDPRVLWVVPHDGPVPAPPDAPLVVPVAALTPDLLRAVCTMAARQNVLEARLADDDARYTFLLDAAGLGDWDMDVHRNRTRRSPRHDALFGHAEMLPTWGYNDFLAHVHPEDRAMVDAAYQRALAGEGDYNVEFRTTWPDGSLHWLSSRGRFVLDAAGVPVRAAGVMAEVTERKLTEQRLQQVDREESIGRLAAGLAHDFNNQLTVVLGAADFLLADAELDADARAHVEAIGRSGWQSARIVRGLLTLSRSEVSQTQALDLAGLVRELARPIAAIVGADVAVRVDTGDEPLPVRGNRPQLEQLLLNLAANARDAITGPGTLEVRAAREGEAVLLRVRDTGSGMDAATLARCFDLFFTTKPRGRGTGLGLASVQRIVRQMGGTIDVESAPGAGTEFRIAFPRAEAAAADPAPASLPRPAGVSGRPRRVLLADDDPGVRAIALRALRLGGYEVVATASGEEAVARAIDAGPFDLLLTDLVMPTMSGRALAEAVLARAPTTQVLLMSGYSDDEVAGYGVDRGAWAFLAKPFTPSTLVERVNRMLRQEAGERAS